MNEDDHERLSFGNKDFESNADDSYPDESITDDSNPDEIYVDELVIIPDEVNPDRTNTDDSNPDNQEDSNATVEGEKHQDQSVNDQVQQSGDTGLENQESANPDNTSGNISGEMSNSGELQIALQIALMMMELMQGEQLVLEISYHLQGNGQKITLLT